MPQPEVQNGPQNFVHIFDRSICNILAYYAIYIYKYMYIQ